MILPFSLLFTLIFSRVFSNRSIPSLFFSRSLVMIFCNYMQLYILSFTHSSINLFENSNPLSIVNSSGFLNFFNYIVVLFTTSSALFQYFCQYSSCIIAIATYKYLSSIESKSFSIFSNFLLVSTNSLLPLVFTLLRTHIS